MADRVAILSRRFFTRLSRLVSQKRWVIRTYTRMLRKALNIHWSSHIPNQQLYGDLPAVSNKIASRRLQLAGHCYRHPELSTQKLVLWEPTHGHRGRGRPITTYIDTLKRDTGAFEASEIAVLMADKRLWKDLVVARLWVTKWVSASYGWKQWSRSLRHCQGQ